RHPRLTCQHLCQLLTPLCFRQPHNLITCICHTGSRHSSQERFRLLYRHSRLTCQHLRQLLAPFRLLTIQDPHHALIFQGHRFSNGEIFNSHCILLRNRVIQCRNHHFNGICSINQLISQTCINACLTVINGSLGIHHRL